MADLNVEQRRFLEKHQIPDSWVFDASGMSKKDYVPAMKLLGKLFAFGVTPCGAGGHTIRTRSGHCCQCDTAKIAYMRRSAEEAFVYVAFAKEQNLVKIGTASDVDRRIDTLNLSGYAGCTDWRLKASFACSSAGKVEFAAQGTLRSSQAIRSYLRNGESALCLEVFDCDVSAAIKAVESALAGLDARSAQSRAFSRIEDRKTPPLEGELKQPITPRRLAELLGVNLRVVVRAAMQIREVVKPDFPLPVPTAQKVNDLILNSRLLCTSPLQLNLERERKNAPRKKGQKKKHRKSKKKGLRIGSPKLLIDHPTLGK